MRREIPSVAQIKADLWREGEARLRRLGAFDAEEWRIACQAYVRAARELHEGLEDEMITAFPENVWRDYDDAYAVTRDHAVLEVLQKTGARIHLETAKRWEDGLILAAGLNGVKPSSRSACPVCASERIHATLVNPGPRPERTGIRAEAECAACKAAWIEHYDLAEFENRDQELTPEAMAIYCDQPSCRACSATRLARSNLRRDDAIIYQPTTCQACHTTWVEVYSRFQVRLWRADWSQQESGAGWGVA